MKTRHLRGGLVCRTILDRLSFRNGGLFAVVNKYKQTGIAKLCTHSTNVARVHVDDLGCSQSFASTWLRTPPHRRAPCIVDGVKLGAVDEWTFEYFRQRFNESRMWDKDQLVKRKVGEFFSPNDDKESYLFEFLGHECGAPPSDHAAEIVASYDVPDEVFGPDVWKLGLFAGAEMSLCIVDYVFSYVLQRNTKFATQYLGADGDYLATLERPEHRWLLMGLPGSGSSLHVDPNGTCAWNKSLVGRKRWVIFDPRPGDPFFVGSSDYEGQDGSDGDHQYEYSQYKVDELHTGDQKRDALIHAGLLSPRTFFGTKDIHRKDTNKTEALEFWNRPTWQGPAPCADFIQNAGQTVFVPAGFWHAVINLDTTLAVTQNFTPPCDTARMLDELGRHPGGRATAARWAARCRDFA